MINYKSGDILKEDVEALVNTVNCVGVMGRGIALQFKNAYPENYKSYVKACKKNEVLPGHMFIFENQQASNPRFIINFPTKRHWRDKSRMEDIETGLDALAQAIHKYNIRSIAIPALGSGLGGLEWDKVRTRIEQALSNLSDVQIIVFEPGAAPLSSEMTHGSDGVTMTPGRAALVELINQYLKGLLDPFITLLEIHKLMYFLQEAGEPLKLKFKKAYYGPYAENLGQVLKKIEGHFVLGYADGGDSPNKKLELMPNSAQIASDFLNEHQETRTRFHKVARLVEGFETPFGLELLATVHWVAKHDEVNTIADIIAQTYAWGTRKKQFTPRQIQLAYETLHMNGWLPEVNPHSGCQKKHME